MLNGGFSSLESVSFSSANNTKYKSRFSVIGTALKSKIWLASDSEPGWMVELTNDAITAAGYCGLYGHGRDFALFGYGVGTDGDPAPSEPIAIVSGEPFQLRHNPRTNKVIPVLSAPTVTDIGANCVRPRVTKGY